jgi:hypothetical protein
MEFTQNKYRSLLRTYDISMHIFPENYVLKQPYCLKIPMMCSCLLSTSILVQLPWHVVQKSSSG